MIRCSAGIAFLAVLLSSCALPSASARELRARQHKALAAGDVLDAVKLGRARVTTSPTDPAAHYDYACALARAGDTADAVAELDRAVTAGFDAPGFLLKDDDLASLRARPDFLTVVEHAKRVEHDGADLPGLKTVIREDLPTKVRLRLPLTGRARVAVWLHPLGARLNSDIERLAPTLAAHGFALVVPLDLRVPGWEEDDLRRLLDQTLPALGDLVDAEHPLLIGFSAGSHAAFAAWARDPKRFTAVIAMGAAPELHGAVLPANASPVFVLNGSEEPVNSDWDLVLPKWQREGRRVTFERVPGFGHEFLLDEALLARLLSSL
ncbi:MAG: hypothetical protein U0228_27840 [Myxococcaceae bacterium]